MRMLYVKDGLIVNVVEHPDPPPSFIGDNGEDLVPSVTQVENAGEAFDVTPVLLERQVDAFNGALLKELLRLTNEVRAQRLVPAPALTEAEYRTLLKTNMNVRPKA